jgi:hypothetical protein
MKISICAWSALEGKLGLQLWHVILKKCGLGALFSPLLSKSWLAIIGLVLTQASWHCGLPEIFNSCSGRKPISLATVTFVQAPAVVLHGRRRCEVDKREETTSREVDEQRSDYLSM